MSDDDSNSLDDLLEEALSDLKVKEEKNKIRAQKHEEALDEAVQKLSSEGVLGDDSMDEVVSMLKGLLNNLNDDHIDGNEKKTLNSLQGVLQKLEKGDMENAFKMVEKLKSEDPLLKSENVERGIESEHILSLLSNKTSIIGEGESTSARVEGGAQDDPMGKEAILPSGSSAQLDTANAEEELIKTVFNACLNPAFFELLEKMKEGFPQWIEARKDTISEPELEIRQKQYEKSIKLCALLKENSNNEKVMEIIDLFTEMSELGELPPDLPEFVIGNKTAEEQEA